MTLPPDFAEQLRTIIRAEFAAPIAELRAFVDRRLAEVSAELSATTDLMDMSEAKLAGMIGDIRGQVCSLIAAPDTSTRNSGLELEAVVQATEAAADRILGAAETISNSLGDAARGSRDSIGRIEDQVNVIFEACSFQDITGQRIRRAILHLRQVEEELRGLGDVGTMPAIKFANGAAPAPGGTGHDLAQAEIDRLLNG
jgi:chemotaxis protein CheZ